VEGLFQKELLTKVLVFVFAKNLVSVKEAYIIY